MNAESTEDHTALSESAVSASIRCMMISELRWKIFDLLTSVATPFRHAFKGKTFIALALTCKAFSETALDLLWRDLHGFQPLIKCLPESLWKQDGRKLEFQRTMTLDDWSIFCKYNYRVRTLVHQCHESYDRQSVCSIDIWRALSCPPCSLPLLPNLTSLTWTEASDVTLQYIRLFATPRLTSLKISPRAHGYSPFSINGTSEQFTFGPSEQLTFSSIAQSCPFVSHFDFDPERFHSMASVGETSTVLQVWSHLTSVRTGTISEAAILHLSDLPSLRVLKCGLPSTSISPDAQKLLQRHVFCALQELDVTCKSLVTLEAFLEQLTITPKTLSFTITQAVDSAQGLPGLTSRLSNVCTHSSLQEVRLCIRVGDQYTSPNVSIEAAAFQPLFAFNNLRKLDFEADDYCIVRMNDAALMQMAKAWPRLEELYISRYRRSSFPVTPNAFVSLLWHCPRLHSVAVLVDWSTIDVHAIPPDIPYQGFSQKALSRLYINGWRIENPTSIAAFISAVAPNVRTIGGWDSDIHEDDDEIHDPSAWTIVRDLITTLPMVREQGRRMMMKRLVRGSYNHLATVQRGGRQ
ncbi:hypothetical protein CY34DRAFT_800697 [Suillus luteus UH-Slu-Lm8-n1]|uniref:Unplaced genomic scaffold CY34scaffold_31, whole genome shotgun sequence n=1 Tax=Suillus luteus UH-Slu-Lm8-n1 TaxID=930992 RepID=A0A0D0A7W0_9AGAM|nr:hypothetical protein CY34DRAFT_800697 [Suillus luteus UH-Slu-Lm8-n1]